MKDIDIDNIIESANSEKKEALRSQLCARIGIQPQEEHQTKSRRHFSNFKASVFGIVGICAVSVAIVLPISLRNDKPEPPQDKYTYNAADFVYDDLGLTIKEYSDQTGKNILFIDWYDIAYDCVTTKYFLPGKEDDIIFIAEDVYNSETGEHIHLDVVPANISIAEFNVVREFCIKDYEYKNTNINWAYDISASRACFEYNEYNYYVILYEPTAEQDILDIVKSML